MLKGKKDNKAKKGFKFNKKVAIIVAILVVLIGASVTFGVVSHNKQVAREQEQARIAKEKAEKKKAAEKKRKAEEKRQKEEAERKAKEEAEAKARAEAEAAAQARAQAQRSRVNSGVIRQSPPSTTDVSREECKQIIHRAFILTRGTFDEFLMYRGGIKKCLTVAVMLDTPQG